MKKSSNTITNNVSREEKREFEKKMSEWEAYQRDTSDRQKNIIPIYGENGSENLG